MAIFSLISIDTDNITELKVDSNTTGYFHLMFHSEGLEFSMHGLAEPVIGLREPEPVRPGEYRPSAKSAVIGLTDVSAEIIHCYQLGNSHRRSTLWLSGDKAAKWSRLIGEIIEPHIPDIVAGWKVPEKDDC